MNDAALLKQLLNAATGQDVEVILDALKVVSESDYTWSDTSPAVGWQTGRLHWIPIGRDRGNWGRIQLAGEPMNPAAERLVNGMEAIIELERRLELLKDPGAPMPASPREAVLRYFKIPRLDQIPVEADPARRQDLDKKVKDLRATGLKAAEITVTQQEEKSEEKFLKERASATVDAGDAWRKWVGNWAAQNASGMVDPIGMAELFGQISTEATKVAEKKLPKPEDQGP